jgi:hypothetical protein
MLAQDVVYGKIYQRGKSTVIGSPTGRCRIRSRRGSSERVMD